MQQQNQNLQPKYFQIKKWAYPSNSFYHKPAVRVNSGVTPCIKYSVLLYRHGLLEKKFSYRPLDFTRNKLTYIYGKLGPIALPILGYVRSYDVVSPKGKSVIHYRLQNGQELPSVQKFNEEVKELYTYNLGYLLESSYRELSEIEEEICSWIQSNPLNHVDAFQPVWDFYDSIVFANDTKVMATGSSMHLKVTSYPRISDRTRDQYNLSSRWSDLTNKFNNILLVLKENNDSLYYELQESVEGIIERKIPVIRNLSNKNILCG